LYCVCLLVVCLSVRLHISETIQPNLTDFLCVLPMAVARSSSDGVAVRYVLPVLWMNSCFQTVHCIHFSDIFLNDKDQHVEIVGCACPEGNNLLCTLASLIKLFSCSAYATISSHELNGTEPDSGPCPLSLVSSLIDL